jgi:DNA polymerase beta
MVVDLKNNIITTLEALHKKHAADNDVWKARAYAKVVNELKKHTSHIQSIEDVRGIPGVGKGILATIQEIIDGGVKVVETDPDYELIEQLLKVYGIGAVKAAELVREKGVRSLQDLEDRQVELLNEKQKLGLKYVKDISLRIPRSEMDKHNKFIIDTIRAIDPKLRVIVSGSYRRGDPSSGDIDVLITYPFMSSDGQVLDSQIIKSIANAFIAKSYISDVLALGDKKCMAVCKLKWHKVYRRIDLMVTKPSQFPFAVLYFTGSQAFNILMRSHALTKGYSLNEYGLKDIKKNQMIDCRFDDEEDVFRFLDLKYVPPTLRSGNTKLLE